MNPVKEFSVLGERVEILIPSSATNGAFSLLIQTSPPGGGPPPHVHTYEDEIFQALDDGFETFDGTQWTPLPPGACAHKLRGQPHAFRNVGATPARMQITVVPGAFDNYLEAISPLQLPQDLDRLIEISNQYGIRFLT